MSDEQDVYVKIEGVSDDRRMKGTYIITIKGQRKGVQEAKGNMERRLRAAGIEFACV